MKRKIKKGKYWPVLPVSKITFVIAGHCILWGSFSFNTLAREVFNPALLKVNTPLQGTIDLSIFETGEGQPPGIYHVDIYLNDDLKEVRDVEFSLQKDDAGNERLQPCLSKAQLEAMGVKTQLYPALGDEKDRCASLQAIPQAKAEFRFSSQQLLLSIPQMAVAQNARGYVPDTQWEAGIPAFLLNYSMSGDNTSDRNKGGDSNSQYANLRPGINIGPWRLRNYTTWNRNSDNQNKWDTVYTYASRNIIPLKSQLLLGDSTSPSDVFDSVPFRGAQLASDEEMLPDSQKGYAPVVRGVARSNAQIIIRQNGYIIYQSYVSAGAFEINDMYPTGGAGDLYVTIKEADGSEQLMVVPFASLPVLQREGRLKYSLTGGQYRSYAHDVDATPFIQATFIYGLPKGFTVYGGSQSARHYHSAASGLGKNLGDLGALSADVTQAWSSPQDRSNDNGQSWRIRYSKNIVQTGTNVAIAGYRYSTSGFYSLAEIMNTWSDNYNAYLSAERRRNRSELTVTQSIGERLGSLSLSYIQEDYWKSGRTMRSIGAGYSSSWNGISYGLNYSYNENSSTQNGFDQGRVYDHDHLFNFNVNVPMTLLLPNTWASYSMNSSKQGSTVNTIGLNGTALESNNLSWNAQQGYASKGGSNSGNLNADYRGTYGEVTSGYSWDSYTRRVNYGFQGGIIAHENGVTFGQQMSETVALVAAPGAAGIAVSNQPGVRTDWRGYAIVPYVTPFRRNAIQLDTQTLPDDVELTLNNQNVVPNRGAVVRANFNASVGQRALMTILDTGGKPIPFGSMVSDPAQKGEAGFIVGDGGQVYLTGLAERGVLLVKWGNDAGQKCILPYLWLC